MKKTGEFLKKAREDKGLSIHEIGLSLKINPKILKQIEDGDKDNLPAKTFLRGFVQSYALFLKVDPNEVLRIFSEEMGTTKPNQISLTSGPQIRGNSLEVEDPENKDDLGIKRHTGQNFTKEKFEFKNIGIGIVVFILLLSLIAVRKVVEKYQKEAEVDVAKTEETLKTNSKIELPQPPPPVTLAPSTNDTVTTDTAPPTDVKAPQPNVPTTQPPAVAAAAATPPKPTSNPPPQTPNAVSTNPTDPPGPNTAGPSHNSGIQNKPPQTSPAVAVTTTANAPTAKPPVTTAVTTNNNKPVVTPTPTAVPPSRPPTVPPTGTDTAATSTTAVPPTPTPPPPPKPKSIELVIEAFETVEIEMTQLSGKVERIKMAPSQIQTFKTVSGVKLNISNGGAVNLIVNGKDLGAPGDLGKPKRVSF